jgi:hypothetical protein
MSCTLLLPPLHFILLCLPIIIETAVLNAVLIIAGVIFKPSPISLPYSFS